MSTPTPALVSQRAAQRLPRLALLLFCAAYVLPGLFGRDPWRNADASAFGIMLSLAEGRSGWFSPALGGVPVDVAWLPHWLGAAAISLFSPTLEPDVAARLPFALLLTLTLVLTWYSAFHLARSEAAQPVAFAFGGEAKAVDYARAMADGALLALIATLGLLQLGHETTPELVQLSASALFLWSLAVAPHRGRWARAAVMAALPLLAASDAPVVALGLGLLGTAVCARSAVPGLRRLAPWVAASALLASALAALLHTWAWRVAFEPDAAQILQLGRQWLWFLWPAWLLALWTVWRWRHHLLSPHLSIPLALALTALLANIATGGSDRALMLGLPAFAVLAAFALPTLQRGTSAAVDWFSVFFFSACALFAWVVYAAMQTGVPAKTLANVIKLAPGFVPRFSLVHLVAAVLGTLAWLWLVRWRTGRHQHALWKSLVLPASGVALTWLLMMTLWLPLLDYARSLRPWVHLIAPHVPAGDCIAAPDQPRASIAALEHVGRWRVDARPSAASTSGCDTLLLQEAARGGSKVPAGWKVVARVQRPTERTEATLVIRRAGASSGEVQAGIGRRSREAGRSSRKLEP